MKTLLILRHAKAQQDVPSAGDWARELTARGRANAETMGGHIRELVGVPDTIVTSDALRARQTAEIVATVAGYDAELTLQPDAYAADWPTLLTLLRAIPDDAETAILVGHNPGLEELAAALVSDDVRAIRLPTAGLAHLEFDVARWRDVAEKSGRWRGVATRRTVS